MIHDPMKEKTMTLVNTPHRVVGVLAAVVIVLMQVALFAHSAVVQLS